MFPVMLQFNSLLFVGRTTFVLVALTFKNSFLSSHEVTDFITNVSTARNIPRRGSRCGNAVPPPFAEALVRANLPELCQPKEMAA